MLIPSSVYFHADILVPSVPSMNTVDASGAVNPVVNVCLLMFVQRLFVGLAVNLASANTAAPSANALVPLIDGLDVVQASTNTGLITEPFMNFAITAWFPEDIAGIIMMSAGSALICATVGLAESPRLNWKSIPIEAHAFAVVCIR